MNIIQKLFFTDKWNIGFTHQTIESLINEKKLKPVTWLKEDKTDYSADPFVINKKNGEGISIYYEDFNFWDGKGKLYHIKDFNFETKKLIEGVPGNIHQSYPYTFFENNVLYCIPETAGLNAVKLYAIDPEHNWKLQEVATLLSGDPYVDSSIIKYNGIYWLFTSSRKRPNELFIFYSDHLKGEYKPHKLNPISSSRRNTRGAGNLFIYQDKIFRPTQNTSVRYGGSIVFNRIIKLTEREYEFEELFEIGPLNPYNEGIHNISFSEDLIVIDGKRRVFNFLTAFKIYKKNEVLYKKRIKNYFKLKTVDNFM